MKYLVNAKSIQERAVICTNDICAALWNIFCSVNAKKNSGKRKQYKNMKPHHTKS